MNELPSEKRVELKQLLSLGMSTRVIATTMRCGKNTVARYARMWKLSVECGCGKPAGHNGWCHVRLDYSPVRRGWLAKRWKMRRSSELRDAVSQAHAAAVARGHNLGPFVWGSATAASAAFATCLTCGRQVRVFGGGSQWERFHDWQRYAGTATTVQCKTAEQLAAEVAAHKEKKQWLEARRTLAELRRVLRNQSPLPNAESRPAHSSRP